MKYRICTLLMSLLFAVTLSAALFADEQPAPLDMEREVAVVNGEKIVMGELLHQLLRQAGRSVLDRMIDMTLIKQASDREEIKVSSDEVEQQLQAVMSNYPDEEAFRQALASHGLDIDAARRDLDLRLRLERLTAEQSAVSPEEVSNFYERNREMYTVPEKVRISHILLDSEEAAGNVLTVLKEGNGKFAELAREHSKCPSRESGGDLQFIAVNDERIDPDFLKAALALQVGETSEVVKTDFGFHIIRVTAREASREIELDRVKADIEERLIDEKRQKVIPEWLKRERGAAAIDIKL